MGRNEPKNDIFGWSDDGLGLRVNVKEETVFPHEVLFEDDVTHLSGSPVFLGHALPPSRYLWVVAFAFLSVSILLGRAFWMQIIDGGGYRLRAEQNRLRQDVLPAKRGIIRDRNGTILAANTPSFDVQLVPWLLPKNAETRDELLGNVGRIIGLGIGDITAAIASSTDPAQSMTLKRDIPYDRAIALNILVGDDPALHVVTGSKRQYPLSSGLQSLSHVLGYVGAISREELDKKSDAYRQTDVIGKTGVEASFEQDLRGQSGERVHEVDAKNRVTSLVGDRAPVNGQDVYLTLDARLQQSAEAALKKELEAAHLRRGAVVAMDPRDGSILAIVSLPAYDDNLFSGSISSTLYMALLKDEDHPLLPRAWAGVYPSGSTVKPVVAVAALAEKVITPNTTVNSVGGIRIGQSFFPDWKAGGHGQTNVRRAIAWSVNTFFYTVGGGYESFIGLGVDRLASWMRRFGLGSKTGLDVPGENAGFVPSKEWKEEARHERWYVGDTYNLSIGQGDLLVTPVQVAAFTSAVANGGSIVRPHLFHSSFSPQGTTTTAQLPPSATPLADAQDIRAVQLGMRDNVIYGSGRALATMPFAVAGKTGTAQWRNDRANHAWFTAYAPFDDPQITVTVLLEEGGEGSAVAVPVARDVLQAWFSLRAGI